MEVIDRRTAVSPDRVDKARKRRAGQVPVTVKFKFRNFQRSHERFLHRRTDGDSLFIEQPVRMVSCDTPEKSVNLGGYTGSQSRLSKCRERLQDGFFCDIPEGLRSYLISRLGSDAAENHIAAAFKASKYFDSLLYERLVGEGGNLRGIAVIAAGEIIDWHGRMLAYLAPWYGGGSSDPIPPKGDLRRDTFNLNMIESGWAAFFPIYPSLPNTEDFIRVVAAAEQAWNNRLGVWSEYGDSFILGYEYRLCLKLAEVNNSKDEWKKVFSRRCVDIRTMTDKGKFGFFDVPPPYRLWVWEWQEGRAFPALGVALT